MANQTVKGSLSSFMGNNGQQSVGGLATLVDIVFLIDGTGSMQNLLDAVRQKALSLHEEIIAGLAGKNRRVEKMRIKVIIYRDIYVDANAFEESEFFTLPQEARDLERFMGQVKATGGGDEPESGLEALYSAMKVRFQQNDSNKKARQIIILMTDASAHRLDDPQRTVDPENIYPSGVPRDLDGLEDTWASLDSRAKKLIVFAPNMWPWTDISLWGSSLYVPSAAGTGISAAAFEPVINMIAGSI